MSEQNVTPMPQFKMKPKLVIAVIIIIAVLGLIMSSFYVVDQTEQAVVLQLGKFNRITGAGLQFKIPFGIEKNYNVPTQQIQNMTFGYRTEQAGINTVYSRGDYPEESIMLTGDLNIIDVEWVIQYRITDPKAWLFNVVYRDQTIRDISQSTINQLVGDRAILDVIGPERTNIMDQAKIQMNKILSKYDLGATVTTVQLKNIVPPAGNVQDAFEDVNKATQDMERLINEGKEEYNKEIPKASGEADKMIQIAQGYATERVNKSRGDVARFLSVRDEYVKNPAVTRTRLYIETMEEVFGTDEGTDLIDKNIDGFLPIKNLQGQGAAQ